MSPYQRAAAVAVAPRPAAAPATTRPTTTRPHRADTGATGTVGRTPWPGRGDRAAQGLLAFSVAVVLAAMACTWLDVSLDLFGRDPGVVEAAVRTWALDAATVLALGTTGVAHSAVRRGRPGRWPVTVLVVAVAASVVLAPAMVA